MKEQAIPPFSTEVRDSRESYIHRQVYATKSSIRISNLVDTFLDYFGEAIKNDYYVKYNRYPNKQELLLQAIFMYDFNYRDFERAYRMTYTKIAKENPESEFSKPHIRNTDQLLMRHKPTGDEHSDY